MPQPLLVSFVACGIVPSFFCILFVFIEKTDKMQKNSFSILWFVHFCLATWLIVASSYDLEIEKETIHKIVDFKTEEGQIKQVFTVDNEEKNANKIFGKVLSKDSVVKRIIYKQYYGGVRFYPEPKFSLESK